MNQIPNPLTHLSESDRIEVLITAQARYRLNERHISVSDVLRILKGERVVWSDIGPDGRTHFVSRWSDKTHEQLNIVWTLEGSQTVTILTVSFGHPDFR